VSEINYEEMLVQVKENLKKVEEGGQAETQFVFTSHRAASDFFYKIINDIDGWVIKSCESRPIPAHYQNTCVLGREEEEKGTADEEVKSEDNNNE